jgi:ABC-2 type transport system permease protein
MLAIIRFDLRQKMRSMSTYVYFGLFFCFALLLVALEGGVFPGTSSDATGKVHINSPFSLMQSMYGLGLFAIVIIAAMMGRAVQQDTEHNIWHFFYSSPISKMQYLGGRFISAFLCLFIIFTSISLGDFIGCFLPGLNRELVGEMRLAAYVLPWLTILLPNLLIFGTLFFSIGALARRMLPVYVLGVVLLIGDLLASGMVKELDNRTLVALLDPFGLQAMRSITEYWSVADKNTRLVPLEGLFLANRLVWGAVALLGALFCYWRFDFSAANMGGKPDRDEVDSTPPAKVAPDTIIPDFSPANLWSLFWQQCRLNLKETIKNVYFGVIVLSGVLLMLGLSTITDKFGTATYPVSYSIIELLSGSFGLFMLIITTFYAGELVWRERDARIAQLLDALPIPNWMPLMAKITTLIVLQGALLLMVMLCGLMVQTVQGYSHYEIGQYLFSLFVMQWPQYALLAVLAVTLQVLIDNKYLAYFAMIGAYGFMLMAKPMGLEHPMWIYAGGPPIQYSDMDGYGSRLIELAWYNIFWGALALAMLALCAALWVRGTSLAWSGRVLAAKHEITPLMKRSFVLGCSLFVLVGSLLLYQNNILQPWRNSKHTELAQANYEKQYKKLASKAQPRITAINMKVDIFPQQRRAQIKGSYVLQNKTTQAIDEIFINMVEDLEIRKFEFDRANQAGIIDKSGFYSYKLQQPLAAGEKIKFDFELETQPKGIAGMGSLTPIKGNGTFFNSGLMPQIGYDKGSELSEEEARKKHGLPAKELMAARDDPKAQANSYISQDADWINFDATVSTSDDQIAIAPGTLNKTWNENGRRYFHYKMEQPILKFYAFLSARYAVKKDKWKDVEIEINYHPGHEYNLDRMIAGVKAGLEYNSQHFGPYQHKLVRIVEFPRFGDFAQAFPNTIPYSESIGFIAKVDDQNPTDIDYPFYVSAHEVGHQWWAHQVVGADAKGSTVLSESLAEYAALMVMQQKYGKDKMRRFLKYNLDQYLKGRAMERKKELPLAHNENQGYIHYGKGSLIMYLLQDQIGADKVNAALRELIQTWGGKGPPYPNSTALINALRKVTPPERHAMLDDMFESIILYENRALSASAKRLGKDEYEVTLTARSKKKKSDSLGAEKEMPLNEWMDIGIDDKDGQPLLRERRLINRTDLSFVMKVKGQPTKAGLDPDVKYIDRKSADNMVNIEMPK